MGPILARYFSGRILSWSVWSILIIPSGSSMLIRVPVRSRSSPKITLTCKTERNCHCVNWTQAKKMEPRLLGKITTEKMFYSARHAESLKRKRTYGSSLKYYLGAAVTLREHSILLSSSWLRRIKGGSAWIMSSLWRRLSQEFWTTQSCFPPSNQFFSSASIHLLINRWSLLSLLYQEHGY